MRVMKFSRAISGVKWLSGFLTAQPFDPADSPRELHHTQSPGKQQISLQMRVFENRAKVSKVVLCITKYHTEEMYPLLSEVPLREDV
jgi:hypothetical protein